MRLKVIRTVQEGNQLVKSGRKIVCVGRNYAKHAKELGNAIPVEPLIFLKPTSAYLWQSSEASIKIPEASSSLHHEVELGVVIGSDVKNVKPEDVMECIAGYVLALDMTARDLQEKAKQRGEPWTISKGFDTSCPISDFILLQDIPDHTNVSLWCSVNGTVRQRGTTSDMIFSIETLVSYISSIMTLNPGDVVLTGTPEGVGPVVKGDIIRAGIGDDQLMQFSVLK